MATYSNEPNLIYSSADSKKQLGKYRNSREHRTRIQHILPNKSAGALQVKWKLIQAV